MRLVPLLTLLAALVLTAAILAVAITASRPRIDRVWSFDAPLVRHLEGDPIDWDVVLAARGPAGGAALPAPQARSDGAAPQRGEDVRLAPTR